MSDLRRDTSYLKIGEAAELLGVNRRTIYRWIWGGKLPASKVGGLYYIRRADLDARLNPDRAAASSPGRATAFGDGQAFGKMRAAITARQARWLEQNFLAHIQRRVHQIETLIHPTSGEALSEIPWEALLERGDERLRVMKLLGKMVLDTETIASTPLNPWVRWRIPASEDGRSALIIQAQALSPLSEMLQHSQTSRPLDAALLNTYLQQAEKEARQAQAINLLLLAAIPGWASDARQMVLEADNLPYRWLLVYLFDLPENALLYASTDKRLAGYAEIFRPISPEDRMEVVIAGIEKALQIHPRLALKEALEFVPYSQRVVELAFEQLAAREGYTLTETPERERVLLRNPSG